MRKMIEKANEFLALQGAKALKASKGFGGKKVVGYRPQYLVDAVNAGIGAENWRYEISAYDLQPGEKVFTAWVLLRLFIRIPSTGEWIQKAEHFGQAQSPSTPGDALKGATTDALGKAFSILSIGKDAYNGSLSVAQEGRFRTSPESAGNVLEVVPSESGQSDDQAPPDSDTELSRFPEIPGVSFQKQGDRIVAVGETYNRREELKKAGFRYNSETRSWVASVAA